MKQHTHDKVCPSCEEKLIGAHTYLGNWFRAKKVTYPSLHISWAWRNQFDQERFFNEGKTKAHWPNSPHNNTKPLNIPWSLALDLFQIDDDGVARFSVPFFALLNKENEAAREPIVWGGKFKSLGDSDHFQYNEKT